MTRYRFSLACTSILLGFAVACGRQAAAPSSPTSALQSTVDAAADGSTLKATAPSPISPVNDQQMGDAPTLTATPSTLKFGRGALAFQYRFELFNDAGDPVVPDELRLAGSGRCGY